MPLLLLPYHFLLGAGFFVLSAALGEKLLGKYLQSSNLTVSEQIIFKIMAGYGTLLYLLWLIGLLGLYRPWLLAGLWLGALYILRKDLRQYSSQVGESYRQYRREPLGILAKILFVIGSLILIEQLISTHAPSVSRDDLSYHLYLPQSYLDLGRITAPPFRQAQSFYPHLLNMSYVPLMALGGELAAKILNFFWLMGCGGLGALIARRLGSGSLGAVATALAVATTPIALQMASSASTDLPSCAYTLAGLLMALIYWENRHHSILILAGVFAALALNKYTSANYWMMTLLLVVLSNIRSAWKSILVFGCFAVACLAPLCLYLWITEGNPLYPYPIGLGFPYDAISKANVMAMGEGSRTLIVLARYLKDQFFSGEQLYAGACLTFLPIAFLFRGHLLKGWAPAALWLTAGLVLRFLLAGESYLIVRYILPTYLAATILSMGVWDHWQRQGGMSQRVLSALLIAGFLVPNLAASTLNAIPYTQWNLGIMSQERYFENFYPSEGWAMVRAVNSLPASSRVAVLDHHFTPYHYRHHASFLWQVPAEIMALNDPLAINKTLKQQGITHVLVVKDQWEPQKTSSGFVLSAVYFNSRLLCRWWENAPALDFLKPLTQTAGGILFALNNSK